MNSKDLVLYLVCALVALGVVISIIRTIKKAKRVRAGFNGGICADCGTRWHIEFSYSGEEYEYVCKCGKHSLPVSSFVHCDVLPEPTAETLMDDVTRLVAGNSITFDTGHRMRLLLQQIPQDRVFENLRLIIRAHDVLVLQSRDGSCTRQLRVVPNEPDNHVAYYDAEGPSECVLGVNVYPENVGKYLTRTLFIPEIDAGTTEPKRVRQIEV